MPEIDTHDDWVQREHWFALAETVHDHLSIAMEGYTITVQGQNGHEFAFDFCLDIEKWGAPGTFAGVRSEEEGRCLKADGLEVGAARLPVRQQCRSLIGRVLDLPRPHSRVRGRDHGLHPRPLLCIDHLAGTFPSNVLSLIHLCIEDHHIWVMQYEEAQNMQAYVEEMEREWPGGRPEDFEYQ